MGLIDKIINKPPVPQNSFKGEDLETVYNTTLKLQNQYLEQNK